MIPKKDKYLLYSLSLMEEMKAELTKPDHKKQMQDIINHFTDYCSNTGRLVEVDEEIYKRILKKKIK